MLAHRLISKNTRPSRFYDAQLSYMYVSSTNAFPTESYAGVYLGPDGNLYRYTEDGNTFQYVWLIGGGTAADYEAYLNVTSGSLGAGSAAEDSWVSLASGALWFSRRSTVGTADSYFDLKIRDIYTLNELASAQIVTTVTVT